MNSYICLLRGINVSGKNKILMADLKKQLESLRVENISTYIQSGNIVFSSPKAIDAFMFELQIKKMILKNYGFDVPVIVRSLGEWEETASRNPFLKNKDVDLGKLHVTFLGGLPESELVKKIDATSFLPDSFEVVAKDVFVHCPESYGETKLSNKYFETKLRQTATTRNWKTVLTLLEMAQNQ
ncbi:MAG: DUF1697 domain-containing protein [Bacteroidia bacterium]